MPGRYEASLRMNRGGAHRSRSLCNCVAVAPTMSATGAIYPKVSFAFGRSQTLCSVCLSRARQPFTPSDAFGIYRRRARLHQPAACRRRRRLGYTRWRASRSSSSPQGGYRPRPPCARAPRLSLSLSLPLFLSHSCDALHALIARQEQEKARGGRGDSLERDPAPLRDRIRLVGPSRVAGGSRGDRQGEVSIGGRDGGRAGDGRGHVPLFQRWVSNSSQSDSDTHSPTRPLAHSLTRSLALSLSFDSATRAPRAVHQMVFAKIGARRAESDAGRV